MKRTTLSALLLGMVLALGMTSTSNAQFYEETNWSSSRTSSSTQSWTSGMGGTTFHSQDTFGGHDAMNTTRITPGRIHASEMRSEFGGYNEVGRMTRPVPGGFEDMGFNNSGAWRGNRATELNMGVGGNYVRNINTVEGFDNRSGFREINSFGGRSVDRFSNSNHFNAGNAWTRGW